ncbi:MAG: 50S ribosomal protein L6 [Chloroflexi bacterium]|nr:50S ribosomal protein L6 [Chloroflexota bacterium]
MSRIGRMPITVPAGVAITIKQDEVTVKGAKGELKRRVSQGMSVALENDKLIVSRASDSREHRSLHGLTRSLLANMVEGVSKGYEKGLEVVGVGYRAEKAGDKLVMRVGFSHQVEVAPALGVSFSVEGTNHITIRGIDKESVGEMAARIRAIRPPDAYKGKGIRYAGEFIKLKPGKTGKAVGGKAA